MSESRHDEPRRQEARRRGIATEWTDIAGVRREVGAATLDALIDALGHAPQNPTNVVVAWDGVLTPCLDGTQRRFLISDADPLPFGIHDIDESTTVISAPRLSPAAPHSAPRSWGIFAPIAALRRRDDHRNIGDLGALRELADHFVGSGASAIGTLPILAMFDDAPLELSPYRPVSRRFFNELHLDVADLVGRFNLDDVAISFPTGPVASTESLPHAGSSVDLDGEWARVHSVLDAINAKPGVQALRDAHIDAFPDVAQYARFRATQAAYGRDWRRWPSSIDPANDHTLSGARIDRNVVDRHCLAQLLMHEQMTALRSYLETQHQFLYLDLPVGAHPDGYDTWNHRDAFVSGVSLGAPPDDFFASGQCWGLPATHPEYPFALYQMLNEAVHHNARYAGVLRIDHIMGLHRQWWVPEGFAADQGAYVHQPADVAWAAITNAAMQNATGIVGENLGTVPVETNDALADHGVAKMFVAQFEMVRGTAALRRAVPAGALASLNTHDLERFATFWEREGDPSLGIAEARSELLTTLGQSNAQMVMVDVADLWGETVPFNQPGTVGSDNWSARYPMSIDAIDATNECLVRLNDARQSGGTEASVESREGILWSEFDLHLFGEGGHFDLHHKLGAHCIIHEGISGVLFSVWAPGVRSVAVCGDWNGWSRDRDALRPIGVSGVWETFVPGAHAGQAYKYRIQTRLGDEIEKADPMASASELPPGNASIVTDSHYQWSDARWLADRGDRHNDPAPVSIYELHLGSWRRGGDAGERVLTYRELAPKLAEYCGEMGYTHVECMPIMEHPFTGSWGYQVTGFFAPTARYGTPDDFRFFVDHLHQHGIGVLLDWVPAHFPDDAHGLATFNGEALYEHSDPREGRHPDWGSLIFNYGRSEVVSFLISNAVYWIDEFHIDGLRVDAVASMLYRDYSRQPGEWIPNRFGGRENLEAIAFLRRCCDEVKRRFPHAWIIAEESTSWPGVTAPIEWGGLGFTSKWDLGWMHDTLEYLHRDSIHRQWHHNDITFRAMYAHSERFTLPLSHDEVVHGKGSLVTKMAGDDWQRRANLRILLGLQFTTPGHKLMFMGGEFGQLREWNHDASLDWHLLEDERHAGLARWAAHLNTLLRSTPALYRGDEESNGFEWIDADNQAQSVYAWLRCCEIEGGSSSERCVAVVIANCTPIPRDGHRFGLPSNGEWHITANSDAGEYGGSGYSTVAQLNAEAIPWQGQPNSAVMDLPPLSVVVISQSPLQPNSAP